MTTPYIFPTENGLRCDTQALGWGRWHISGHFHFSVQPWSTRQLMETDHWHKMQAGRRRVDHPRRPAYGGWEAMTPTPSVCCRSGVPEPNALASTRSHTLLLICGAKAPTPTNRITRDHGDEILRTGATRTA